MEVVYASEIVIDVQHRRTRRQQERFVLHPHQLNWHQKQATQFIAFHSKKEALRLVFNLMSRDGVISQSEASSLFENVPKSSTSTSPCMAKQRKKYMEQLDVHYLSKRREQRLTKTCFLLSSTFVICWLPFVTLHIYR